MHITRRISVALAGMALTVGLGGVYGLGRQPASQSAAIPASTPISPPTTSEVASGPELAQEAAPVTTATTAPPTETTVPEPEVPPVTVGHPRPTIAPPARVERATGGGVWSKLAQCESGGDPTTNTGNGYFGAFQFALSTWRGIGETGYPHQHSYAAQLAAAKRLQARSGWGQWPACSRQLGLR